MNMQGKVAIVTGASAGIGRAYALALAGEGATVIAAARRLGGSEGETQDANTLASLVKASETLPGRIHAQVCDVEREADVVRLVDHTIVNFDRIDVLVNNAAALWQFDALKITADAWDRLMTTNVRAPYVAIREAAPHMMRQRSGSIINITAGVGNLTPKSNYSGGLAYGVSKAALNRLSYFMAAELRPYGIAVNSLSPGVVLSESTLAARPEAAKAGTHKPCTPEVLGPALICLARQTAETLTGQILHTDEFQKSWPMQLNRNTSIDMENTMHDIETIKTQLEICSLKARQLRLVDAKEWVGYSALLTEDFVLDLSQAGTIPVIHGRDAAVRQIQTSVADATTVHHAHLPEFELKDDEVLVTWAMHDRIVRGPGQPSFTLYGYHHDRWVRHNGEWKLAQLRTTTLHLDVHAPTGA